MDNKMYRILVVDDERIERMGIAFLIKKYELPLKVVEAYNGEEALEVLQNQDIDIMLTDIKMPFMDGMELIEKAYALNPFLRILVFSAYGEFEYAKQAMRYGVKNYILKPVDDNEFLQAMHKVIKDCEHMDKYSPLSEDEDALGGQFLNDCIKGNMEHIVPDMQCILKDAEGVLLLIDTNERFFDSHNGKVERYLADHVPVEYYYSNINEYQSVMLMVGESLTFSPKRVNRVATDILNFFDNHGLKTTIVQSDAITELSEIKSRYEKIENRLDNKYFFSKSIVINNKKVVSSKHAHNISIKSYVKEMNRLLELDDFVSLKKVVKLFFDSLESQVDYDTSYIKFICTDFVKRTIDKTDLKRDLEAIAREIYNTGNIQELEGYVLQVLSKIKSSQNEDHQVKKIVKKIKSLIEENYMNDISLDWIAEQTYLSPNYVSIIVKKHIGCSFIKYITGLRINRAKEYLQETNFKVRDIAERVGYGNASYFCVVFRNLVGMTPAKYREDHSEL